MYTKADHARYHAGLNLRRGSGTQRTQRACKKVPRHVRRDEAHKPHRRVANQGRVHAANPGKEVAGPDVARHEPGPRVLPRASAAIGLHGHGPAELREQRYLLPAQGNCTQRGFPRARRACAAGQAGCAARRFVEDLHHGHGHAADDSAPRRGRRSAFAHELEHVIQHEADDPHVQRVICKGGCVMRVAGHRCKTGRDGPLTRVRKRGDHPQASADARPIHPEPHVDSSDVRRSARRRRGEHRVRAGHCSICGEDGGVAAAQDLRDNKVVQVPVQQRVVHAVLAVMFAQVHRELVLQLIQLIQRRVVRARHNRASDGFDEAPRVERKRVL